MEKHHLLGPSRLEARQFCPASYQIEKEVLEKLKKDTNQTTDSKPTLPRLQEQIGIAIESIPTSKWDNAKQIRSFFKKDKEDYRLHEENDRWYTFKKNDIEYCYSNENLKYTIKTIKYLSSRVKNPQFVRVNERLEYKDERGETIYFGTPNIVTKDQDGLLMVFKWKTGYYDDEIETAKESLQLKAYVLAAMQKYNAEKCKGFIYNPIVGKHTNYLFVDREKIESEILRIINICTGLYPPRVAGYPQCDFCLGKTYGVCSEWKDEVLEEKAIQEELTLSPAEELPSPKPSTKEELKSAELAVEEEIYTKDNTKHLYSYGCLIVMIICIIILFIALFL